ncbi:MAG: Fe2+-dependent dioxygenase [bacterium]
MQLLIEDLIPPNTIATLRRDLQQQDLFEQGSKTAASKARRIKNNLQLKSDHPKAKEILNTIKSALLSHAQFMAATLPKQFAAIMINQYIQGMSYGAHIDEPFINHIRTDISFTLFLSDPNSYEGGALCLFDSGTEQQIKPKAGSVFLYPSTYLHAVTPVTSGTRYAAIGWVQSIIRSPDKRNILYSLQSAANELQRAGRSDLDQAEKFLAAGKANLLRRWAE